MADTHYRHKNIVNLAGRPFRDSKEMDECQIESHNSVIKKGDIVYHLGDLAFTENGQAGIDYLKWLKDTLNGEIRVLLGNHDNRKQVEEVFGPTWMPRGLHRIRHQGERIVICHYSLRTWEGQHYGAWHLFGHSHGSLTPFGKSVDVGVDANFLERDVPWGTPYHFDEIKAFMDVREVAVPDRHQKAGRR